MRKILVFIQFVALLLGIYCTLPYFGVSNSVISADAETLKAFLIVSLVVGFSIALFLMLYYNHNGYQGNQIYQLIMLTIFITISIVYLVNVLV